MTTFNDFTVINRGNRPSPISPAKLDFFFVKDGVYMDPYQVCSVHVFPNSAFDTATPYINTESGSTDYGLVSSTANNIVFHNQKTSEEQVIGFDGSMDAMAEESDYGGISQPNSASGIFRTDPGMFSVILQTGTEYYSTSATTFPATPPYTNTASGTGGYIDIWTVVDAEDSKAQIYVSVFDLQTANVFATVEPLAVTTTNTLIQRYIDVGSKKNLQIKTELVVDSEPMKASLRNLMETGALISKPAIRIAKINESPALTSRVQLFGGTGFRSTDVRLGSDGTISYLWDTSQIEAFYESDVLGGALGVYEVQVKYSVLDEVIYSPKFKLIVR